jgi:electron transport complex protein RnfD
LPPTFAGIYFFGVNALLVIISSLASAVLFDLICQKLTKHNIGFNGSAIITGLLLALILPPTVPLWLPIFGSAFAIGLAKYAFGPGNNIFNPALIGRTFLAISFPLLMSTYIAIDGTTSATPLTVAKLDGYTKLVQQYETKDNLYSSLFIGNRPGSLGETSVVCILAGGIFLILMRIIDWKIPFFYLSTVAVAAFAFKQDILFYLLAGGLMLGAFFMATDYVTTPLTKKGRVIFAIGCGFLTVVLRIYSGYPEAVAFSILLMNAATPLIDRLTKPKPLGY